MVLHQENTREVNTAAWDVRNEGLGVELTLPVVAHSHFAYLIRLFIRVRAPLANVDRMLSPPPITSGGGARTG